MLIAKAYSLDTVDVDPERAGLADAAVIGTAGELESPWPGCRLDAVTPRTSISSPLPRFFALIDRSTTALPVAPARTGNGRSR